MFKAIFLASSNLAAVPLADRAVAFTAGVAVFAGLALWRGGGI